MHIYIVRVFVSGMAQIKISQMGLHWMGGNVHANKAVLRITSGCALSVNLSLSGPSPLATTDRPLSESSPSSAYGCGVPVRVPASLSLISSHPRLRIVAIPGRTEQQSLHCLKLRKTLALLSARL